MQLDERYLHQFVAILIPSAVHYLQIVNGNFKNSISMLLTEEIYTTL